MTVSDRVETLRQQLTAAERRVASTVLADPQAVAFGTVASLARRAETSGATVVRLANRLGYGGFVELQSEIQQELAGRLRPAVERIRQPADDDTVERALRVEVDNVTASLATIDRRAFARAATKIASAKARVVVMPGSASYAAGHVLAEHLGLLRDGVTLAWGAPTAVTTVLAPMRPADVVVAIDVRRYDVALLDAFALLTDRRVPTIAITDSLLSPLARRATTTFAIAAEGAGPFDSHVGAIALVNALVAEVAARLRSSATRRLDRVEQAWREAGVVADS